MSFTKLFQHSNLSVGQLRGNVITAVVQQIRGDLVTLDTGLKTSTVCFSSELNTSASVIRNTSCIIGIESMEIYGEAKIILPNHLDQISKRKLVWTELTQRLRSLERNRMKGFILNSVNGGYAVALAGHIAFLPKSLRRGRKIFHSQWRLFSILTMNAKIGNIVVKEITDKTKELKRRLKRKPQNYFLRNTPFFEAKMLRPLRPIGKKPKPILSYASSRRRRQKENMPAKDLKNQSHPRPLIGINKPR